MAITIKRIDIGKQTASPRLRKACGKFGIGLTHAPTTNPPTSPLHTSHLETLLSLKAGQIALLTGPSGSGKTTLLSHLRARLRAPNTQSIPQPSTIISVTPPPIYRWNVAAIDLIPVSLDRALRLLSLVGLADALLLGRTYSELSGGERARLDLARAFARVPRHAHTWLLADEFLTPLDRPTASAIAHSIRRAIPTHFPNLRLIAATAHTDLTPHLHPDLQVTTRPDPTRF